MKMKRILSTLLAVLMSAGAFVTVASAAEATKPYEYKTGYTKGETVDYDKKILTADEKIDSMDYRYGNGKYELYVDAYSGEVAVVNVQTGDKLFTNPYNFASMTQLAKSLDEDKTNTEGATVMSQLYIYYKDITTNEKGEYNSYKWAATKGQIQVKDIRGGLRVEYSIGQEESRVLLPERISEKSFNEKIKSVIESSSLDSMKKEYFLGYFTKYDPDTFGQLGSAQRNIALANLGISITWDSPFYVLDTGIDNTKKQELSQIMTEYCPGYTFEDIDEDHLEIGYSAEEVNYPLFKMALEYTIDEYGLSVRLPANGIRYDDSKYTLEGIEILPYMGVGTTNNGYNFFPDGSGTLFSFAEMMEMGSNIAISANIYGSDFAYQEIDGSYEEVIRYPVFGLSETETLNRKTVNAAGAEVTETYERERGFVAIVEEGESLMSLKNFSRSYSGAGAWQLNGIKMTVQPRPKDSYKLDGSTAASAGWDVVSSKKFTGSFRIRYIMLSDSDLIQEFAAQGVDTSEMYRCSYVGMAQAYRNYLIRNGVLTKLTSEQVREDIPLYIKTLGAMKTTKKILSIPITVMSSLTSFSDVATIRDQLAKKDITNINFILTGYTKGGLTDGTVPYNLKWESAVSDDMDFEDLVADAKADQYGIFPDFDFAFAANNKLFDGLSLKKHAVKTVENRYTSKREYSATKHTTISNFEIALSPAYFSHFYEKLLPKYQKYQPVGISVSTLGSYLNSDFDEDEPYNREDNKEYTVQALKAINDSFIDAQMDVEVMTSAANAYAWQYVDHITDIALDSSRYKESYASVPFLGIVLHGYVELAGSPINMEGNLDYTMLKLIESGAALQFLVVFDNAAALKENEKLSQNYSVQYDIWYDDIVSMYTELNNVLKSVQTSAIVEHEFISGLRVPDLSELLADAQKELAAAMDKEASLENANNEAEREKVFAARKAILDGTAAILKALNPEEENSLAAKKNKVQALLNQELTTSGDAENPSLFDILNDATKLDKDKKDAADETVQKLYNCVIDAMDEADELLKLGNAANSAMAVLTSAENTFPQEVLDDLQAMLTAEYQAAYQDLATNHTPAQVRDALLDVIRNAFTAEGLNLPADWTMSAFTYEIQTPTEGGEENNTQQTVGSGNRYQSETNKIVREKFENGADFLLNFNDYQVVVTVEVDGVMKSYTIDAYSYVILHTGSN